MIIKGIDNGYGYTKDESKVIFRSAYTTDEPLSLNTGHHIRIDDKDYWVGIGTGTMELNKANTEVNKVCTLTCLAMSPNTDFCIVAGLPINQFKQDRDKLKDAILEYSGTKIQLDDNNSKIISIRNVAVYPQSAATIYTSNITDDIIIVDIGFRTVDIVLVQYTRNKPNITRSDTYYCGMFSLYDLISNRINQKFELTTTAPDIEHILNRGLYIDGVKQDLQFLSAILKEYYNELFTQLSLKYPVKTTSILLTGGGAEFVHKAFLKRFPQTFIHKDNQFSNAQGYYQIGLRIFS